MQIKGEWEIRIGDTLYIGKCKSEEKRIIAIVRRKAKDGIKRLETKWAYLKITKQEGEPVERQKGRSERRSKRDRMDYSILNRKEPKEKSG